MKIIKILLPILVACIAFCSSTLAQDPTVGLLNYDISKSYEGYTLIYPHNQSNIYLIDNCGEVVHSWIGDDDYRPGNTAYLRDDGSLVKTKRNSSIAGDAIWAGGGGGIVEILSWDNEVLCEYELNNDRFRLHHDIAVKPDGNIIMLAWELKTREEAEAMARIPDLLAQEDLWPEYVFEINPDTDEIVWEWHAWDHLIQDVDPDKPNYGVISENLRRININHDENDRKADWMHANAIDYNPELNQIMVSIPYFNELWIIDRSTTTAQAASSVGGQSNHGGDLICRLGNPQVYGKGDSTNQTLYFQHDTHWADDFLPTSHPQYGNIVAFNNRVGSDYSTVEVFTSSWEMYISDYQLFNGEFLPLNSDQTIYHPDTSAIYSTGMSSAQFLPNGNILICSGRQGYLVELTPDNEIVWEYVTPLQNGQAVVQGTELSLSENPTFRAFRYPVDYSAFTGRDLSAKSFIELEPLEEFCEKITPIALIPEMDISVYPNPASDMIHLSWDTGVPANYKLVNLLGHTVLENQVYGGMAYINMTSLETNVYLLYVNDHIVQKIVKR